MRNYWRTYLYFARSPASVESLARSRSDIAVATLFWTIVILLLLLTGAIIPVLYFGFGRWSGPHCRVARLGFPSLCGFVLQPFAMIASDVAGWARSRNRLKRLDPDRKHYVELASEPESSLPIPTGTP